MVQDQVAPARFRVDQAATLAGSVKVLVKGTTPDLSRSDSTLGGQIFTESERDVFQPLTSNQMLPLPEVRDL